LARGMGSMGGCGDQLFLFNGWDRNWKNLIKDWRRDHNSIIDGYGYFKPFKKYAHTHTHTYTMKSLGPMTSWPMAINCPKKNIS
jgi:hypothetical protein